MSEAREFPWLIGVPGPGQDLLVAELALQELIDEALRVNAVGTRDPWLSAAIGGGLKALHLLQRNAALRASL